MPQAVVGLEARSGAGRGWAALAVWLAAVSLVALVPPSVSVAAEDVELLASDAEAADQFGAAVSVSTATASTVALIGAPLEDGTSMLNAGVAYVFRSDGMNWAQEQKLTASVVHAQDQFGISVAVSGNTAVIGANDNDGTTGGLAYLFRRTGSVWVQEEIFMASDVPSGMAFPGDAFGAAVSIASGTAVVGAPLHVHSAVASGSAYVFSVPEPSPALLAATALLALAALRRRSR